MVKCRKGDDTTSVKRHICSHIPRLLYKLKSRYTTEDAADQIKRADEWTVLQRRESRTMRRKTGGIARACLSSIVPTQRSLCVYCTSSPLLPPSDSDIKAVLPEANPLSAWAVSGHFRRASIVLSPLL